MKKTASKDTVSSRPIVITGLQSTHHSLHLGHYFGVMPSLLDYQDKSDLFLFVADLHSLTPKEYDFKNLWANKLSLIFTYIACGIDLNKTKMFFQSDVSAHPQLSWLLTCQTTIGELNRMTQFKDKSQKSAQNGTDYIPTGLLVYPPLMAADILLYDANFVPVGADQKQHLELTRDVAIRFNNKFGKTFTIPEPHISTVGAKIQDLKTPSKKMSKSSADPSGVIFLLDDPELAHKKIMTALTDNLNKVKFDPKTQPGISNLITIASCLTKKDIKEIEKKYSNIKNYGEFKRDIADGIKELLIKFQARYKKAQNEQDKILDKIAKITVECNKISQKKLSLVYDRMGIRPAAKIKK